MAEKAPRLIIVSGLSGAGKTVLLNALEDLSYYAIYNLPAGLLGPLIEQFTGADGRLAGPIAISIDTRHNSAGLDTLPAALSALAAKRLCPELIFVEADPAILTRRFSETRRKHPFSSADVPLADAIRRERRAIGVIAEAADLRLDTSHLNLHELREVAVRRIARRPQGALSLQIMSFGYKNGLPGDADFVFDLRCLPNPYWHKALRALSGREPAVADFLQQQPAVTALFDELRGFLDNWLPRFEAGGRSYLGIALGCTGGLHRSVFMAEQLARYFEENGRAIILRHRDI